MFHPSRLHKQTSCMKFLQTNWGGDWTPESSENMTGFLGKRTTSNPSFQSHLSAFPPFILYIYSIFIKISLYISFTFIYFPPFSANPLLYILRLGPYAPHASRPTPPGWFRKWPWPDAANPGSVLQRWVSALRPGDSAKHCNGTQNLWWQSWGFWAFFVHWFLWIKSESLKIGLTNKKNGKVKDCL